MLIEAPWGKGKVAGLQWGLVLADEDARRT